MSNIYTINDLASASGRSHGTIRCFLHKNTLTTPKRRIGNTLIWDQDEFDEAINIMVTRPRKPRAGVQEAPTDMFETRVQAEVRRRLQAMLERVTK